MGGTRESSSHKGFLTGGGGLLFQAYDISSFTDMDTYYEWMDKFLEGLRKTPPAPGEDRVLYPGLYAYETTQRRIRNGIPYHPEVIFWYQSIAEVLRHQHLYE